MHVVTGGAGFIGSNTVAALAARGDEVVVCDWLRSDERWRIAKHEIAALIAPEDLPAWLRRNGARVESAVHPNRGISATIGARPADPQSARAAAGLRPGLRFSG